MYDLNFLSKIIKYSLFSLALASLIFVVLLAGIYLQGTAVEMSRPEMEISPRGARAEASPVVKEFSEEQLENSTRLQHRRELIGNTFSGKDLEAIEKSMVETRLEFLHREKEEVLKQRARKYERELDNYREQQLADAEADIEEKEREIEGKMQELAVEIDERELEMLQDFRRTIGQDYKEELMNLRLKKRVLDLSEVRKSKLDERIRELESKTEMRMEEIRRQLESRLRQEMMREAAQLEHELNIFASSRLARAEDNIAMKEEALEEELLNLKNSEKERLAEYNKNYTRRLDNIFSVLKERYQHFSR